jgi:sugar-specific transcriptional regulator TrmB
LLNPEEYVEILAELGLTHMQARVYLALVFLKNATARDIHKYSNVARQDVYRMLSELEEKDMIERVIAKPTKFRPIPPNEAIFILLQRGEEKTRLLQKEATRMFRKLQERSAEPSLLDESGQFILLSKSETKPMVYINRLREAVRNAKTSVMALTNFQLFMQIKDMDEQMWKKAVRRGVKFKLIVDGASEKCKIDISLNPGLRNTDNFEIRWTATPSSASVLLVDEREVFCRIGHDSKSPVLLSTSPCFVAMIKDFFDMKWKSLKDGQEQSSLPK